MCQSLNDEASYCKWWLPRPTCLGGDQPCGDQTVCTSQTWPPAPTPSLPAGAHPYESAPCNAYCVGLNGPTSYCKWWKNEPVCQGGDQSCSPSDCPTGTPAPTEGPPDAHVGPSSNCDAYCTAVNPDLSFDRVSYCKWWLHVPVCYDGDQPCGPSVCSNFGETTTPTTSIPSGTPTTQATTIPSSTSQIVTTQSATTLTPTTQVVTTVTPTTQAVTTVPPTTHAVTTVPPTTQAVTTVAPTTQAGTTAAPTTQATTIPSSTSQTATTQSVTTVAATTQAATTVVATTQAVTSAEATTQAVTTVPPTTQVVTTVAPTTQAVTSVEATTQAVTTVPPTTQVVTTVAPTTQAVTAATPTTQVGTSAAPTTRVTTISSSTSHYLEKIGRSTSKTCRLCGYPDETWEHLTDQCPKLSRLRYMVKRPPGVGYAYYFTERSRAQRLAKFAARVLQVLSGMQATGSH
ncbi:Cell wall integrity and stress response component 3 precursor, putative [Perkinsus marinus ATCC 50983]|uniref:Cell wall integrity and stress response component 3, putative n=1 Tax=Perkinsus marinus (strain ATCC 50983 / TXsc) TaxID=423536 RepID=C5LF38_PERM5|nr:Cell wall integrity and stress response component 3 precursor, putative [Perkinsus marinus ATCC 50983]EER04676.1 Cell wall integrity and stress response component 3 precursor, putative [Perkinsus marinus ATCC 50983]|eukprot:XP_002772860.1 Cell wall integrity and stress response component 3 precursor, putative [Perkinsus marinus ATCC 50983]